MGTGILLATIGMAVVFDVTNGFHDSANSVAALVATRAATPVQALVVATAGNFAGPLLMGTAVADTVGGVVIVAPHETLPAIGAALSLAPPSWMRFSASAHRTRTRRSCRPTRCGPTLSYRQVAAGQAARLTDSMIASHRSARPSTDRCRRRTG